MPPVFKPPVCADGRSGADGATNAAPDSPQIEASWAAYLRAHGGEPIEADRAVFLPAHGVTVYLPG